MRKLMGILLLVVLALSACNNAELAITEVKSIPKDVQKVIDQLDMHDDVGNYVRKIYDVDKKISYIVINTAGEITTSISSNDDKITVNIEEVEGQSETSQQYVYKVTQDKDYEYFLLTRNGEEIPFDVVTGF